MNTAATIPSITGHRTSEAKSTAEGDDGAPGQRVHAEHQELWPKSVGAA
jgi:hypothetical protein